MAHNQVSVGTSATLIVPANNNRRGLMIDNQGAVTVFWGDDSLVSTTNTVSIRAGQELVLDDRFVRVAIYGIVASGSATVGWLEIAQ